MLKAKAYLALSQFTRMLQAKQRITLWLTQAESALVVQESSKLHSKKKLKLTSSVNRQFSAAVLLS